MRYLCESGHAGPSLRTLVVQRSGTDIYGLAALWLID